MRREVAEVEAALTRRQRFGWRRRARGGWRWRWRLATRPRRRDGAPDNLNDIVDGDGNLDDDGNRNGWMRWRWRLGGRRRRAAHSSPSWLLPRRRRQRTLPHGGGGGNRTAVMARGDDGWEKAMARGGDRQWRDDVVGCGTRSVR